MALQSPAKNNFVINIVGFCTAGLKYKIWIPINKKAMDFSVHGLFIVLYFTELLEIGSERYFMHCPEVSVRFYGVIYAEYVIRDPESGS